MAHGRHLLAAERLCADPGAAMLQKPHALCSCTHGELMRDPSGVEQLIDARFHAHALHHGPLARNCGPGGRQLRVGSHGMLLLHAKILMRQRATGAARWGNHSTRSLHGA